MLANESLTPRYYNLKIKGGSISPCVVTYNFHHLNDMYQNNHKLRRKSDYWYYVESIAVGDKIDIVVTHRETGQILKRVQLQVVEKKKSGIRLIELTNEFFKAKRTRVVKTLDLCPTCHQKILS